MKNPRVVLVTVLVLALAAVAYYFLRRPRTIEGPAVVEQPKVLRASVELRGPDSTAGVATLIGLEDGSIRLDYDVNGLPPGRHQIRYSPQEDCAALDATSAIGLGEAAANLSGRTRGTLTTTAVSLSGEASGVLVFEDAEGESLACGHVETR